MKTRRYTPDPENLSGLREETKRRYDETPDEDIDFSETPDYGHVDWTALKLGKNAPKPTVTMRVDEAVIAHFKAEDPKGYTARMAAVLRAYVEAQKADAKA